MTLAVVAGIHPPRQEDRREIVRRVPAGGTLVGRLVVPGHRIVVR